MGLIALGYLYWMRRVGYSPFQTVGGGGLMGYFQSQELGTHNLSSEVYPVGKLQSHFTCGFNFRYYCHL